MIMERELRRGLMTRSISAFLGLIVSLVFVGCAGRYAFEKMDGGVYRLDTWTGETTWLVGGEASKVLMPKEKVDLEENLGQIKEFKHASLPIDDGTNLTVSLRTIWRNGKLFYNVKCTPYNEKVAFLLNKKSPQITFFFVDKYSFPLFHQSIGLSDMRRSVSDDGVEFLETTGNVAMDRTTYMDVQDVRYGHGGFVE